MFTQTNRYGDRAPEFGFFILDFPFEKEGYNILFSAGWEVSDFQTPFSQVYETFHKVSIVAQENLGRFKTDPILVSGPRRARAQDYFP